MENKKILLGIGMLILVVLTLNVISARESILVCLERGQVIEYSKCNPNMVDRTCEHDSCPHCVYVGSNGFYCPDTRNPNPCNRLGLTCSDGGDYSLDQSPPEISFFSINDGDLYDDDRVEFRGEANEKASWYYSEDNGNRWRMMCSKKVICEDRLNFDEGENNIVFKVVDVVGNEINLTRTFTIDDKKPKIYKTLPKKGFADGNFYVKFKEANPENLTLFYGEDSYLIDVATECVLGKKYYECEFNLDLSGYDGQEIVYWFELTDIVGNFDDSKRANIKVDVTAPVINNPDSMFEIKGNYVYFEINITEENFEKASYIDMADSRLRERKLCSRLKDGICEKKKRFRDGHYDLTINVIDEAGNPTAESISFDIV